MITHLYGHGAAARVITDFPPVLDMGTKADFAKPKGLMYVRVDNNGLVSFYRDRKVQPTNWDNRKLPIILLESSSLRV